ncbi:hypothetical protein HX792_08115 [Pseudomonas sp. B6002]|uniref:hypothetical protein n=1 Tax=Pseudomonas sp. B6002 TaxID=2726978 RepID=UPI0015A48C1C|nr:hypothetical protein [Pseudomonas sp. B6002]NVZ50293.1 hypothetical protein [Pseudomonas sp. B6002]
MGRTKASNPKADLFPPSAEWGGGTNGELKRLMLRHAFQWVDTVWFHVAGQNIRLQRAMETIGGQFSHTSIKQLANGTQENCFYKIERARFEGRCSVVDA